MKHTLFPSLFAILTVSLTLICGRVLAKDAKEFASTRPAPTADTVRQKLINKEIRTRRAMSIVDDRRLDHAVLG